MTARRPKNVDNVPELSPEEVQRRIDMLGAPAEPPRGVGRDAGGAADLAALTDATLTDWIGEPTSDDAPRAPTARVVRRPSDRGDRRVQLWRDSAMILIVAIIAALGAEVFLPGVSGVPSGSPTAFPSGVAVGSVPPRTSLPPGVTFGPPIDPSLGIDATPTPIPVITLGPSPTPSPTPEPTATRAPSASPKPSPKPSKTPTPTLKPTPTPALTPPPTPALTPPPTDPPTDPPTETPPVP